MCRSVIWKVRTVIKLLGEEGKYHFEATSILMIIIIVRFYFFVSLANVSLNLLWTLKLVIDMWKFDLEGCEAIWILVVIAIVRFCFFPLVNVCLNVSWILKLILNMWKFGSEGRDFSYFVVSFCSFFIDNVCFANWFNVRIVLKNLIMKGQTLLQLMWTITQ